MARPALIILACLIGAAAARGAEVDYLREVKPLLRAHCYACHGALRQEAGLRLDTAELLKKGGKSGPALLAGERPGESPLVRRITSTDPATRMPREGQPLTAEQIAVLTAWASQGAPAPADEQPEVDPGRHWSFQCVERPAVPAVTRAPWVRNPVDAFLAAGHERHGLVPIPEAERHVLLRRVFIDLTGLPPSREQLRAFLADSSPDAYDRVVEQLLAAPAYGERWGRHWMDVWRYSDWYGRRAVPDVMNSYAMVWRWRDWIVRSLNEDKGYDRMVVEMLAADEVAPADDANVVATGFVVRNWFKWNYNQWMRDSVEHTGKAFLGLTLNCAHCHDHKYDPISKADYFRFRAFFEPLELRHDRVPGEPDPGPFVKYVYGAAYGPIPGGMVRVFDERPDAPTLIYNGGDERNKAPGEPPVAPGVPASLGGVPPDVRPVDLPPAAWYPGLKPFIQREELGKAREAVAAAGSAHAAATAAMRVAEGEWARVQMAAGQAAGELGAVRPESSADVQCGALTAYRGAALAHRVVELNLRHARSKLESLEATIAADRARYGSPQTSVAVAVAAEAWRPQAQAASRAERVATHAAADLALATVEQALFAAKQPGAAADVHAKAEQQFAAATGAEAAARAALATVSDQYAPLGPVFPRQSTGRRAALARWIASRENPLAARVAVNHIWLRHFGSAIVPTVFDFGRNGKPPSHPALLDWLAADLMEHGWSMKHVHRLIVTSSAYRMASAVPARSGQLFTSLPANEAADPDNRWLWRFNGRRMEAEVVRDSVLAVAGELDPAMGGPDIDPKQGLASNRRSVYFTTHGEEKMRLLELFDAPEVTDCYRRTETVVPQQALALANSELSLRAGRALAAKLWEAVLRDTAAADDAARVRSFVAAAFEQVLARPPSAEEAASCVTFLSEQAALVRAAAAPQPDPGDAERVAREDMVHALLNHNDFVTVR
jgi:mono/diheme cytochrome c family protein